MNCKDCKWCINFYEGKKVCSNGKITELLYEKSENVDELRYPYEEGGYFEVGPLFGCVHFEKK